MDILGKMLLEFQRREKGVFEKVIPLEYACIIRLTPRQIQITDMLLDDYSYGRIAEELSLSLNTVRSHARRIYATLGVKGKRGLRAWLSQEDFTFLRERFGVAPK